MKRTLKNPALRRLLALLTAVVLTCSMFTMAFATEATNAVNNDRTGVLCIEYGYVDDNDGFTPIMVGSGFLINEDTMLTCYHVVHILPTDTIELSDGTQGNFRAYMEATYGDKWEKHMGIRVILSNGSYVGATEDQANAEVDYSILKLSKDIQNHQYLALRSTEVTSAEKVYALGFPYVVTGLTEGTAYKYTAEDVTVTESSVSKASTLVDGMNYIQHNAIIKGGSSGGPLVDANGAVVGINKGVDAETGSYSYAININQVMLTLNDLGIEYELADGAPVEPIAPSVDDPVEPSKTEPEEVQVDKTALQTAISTASAKSEDDYTTESWTALAAALSSAQALVTNDAATQEDVNAAVTALNNAVAGLAEKASGPNVLLIIIIVAAVVVIAIIVVVIILVTKKKKPAEDDYASVYGGAPVGGGYNPPMDTSPVNNGGFVTPNRQGVQYEAPVYNNGGAGETGVLNNAGETSVLFSGAGETSVLSSKPYAILVRKSSGEQVTVSAANFTIGRERRRVDYCVENNSVSRSHAKLTNSNGSISVVDLGSANGTFVNGVKCAPNTSVPVKNGDKLVLADEEFEIRLL